MAPQEQTMTDVYARYFFSLFDACLHQDEAGLQLAQQNLEDFLTRLGPGVWAGPDGTPEPA